MIAAWMVYATVVAAFAGVAALALDRLLRPHGRALRGVWAGAMVLGSLLPLIGIRLEPLGRLLLRMLPISGAPAPGGARILLDPVMVGGSTGAMVWPGIDAVLGLVWLAASVGLLGWWALARQRLRSLIDPLPSGSGMEGRIVVTPGTGPAVVGVLRPRILVPRWLADGDPDRLALALRHEREHVAARDPALLTASFLLRAALPWNPVLWWMAGRLREAVEVDCDRRVLRRRPQALHRYADTLLTVSARDARLAGSGAAALAEPTSLLERRIRTMTAPRPKYPVLRAVLLGGVALLALAVACSAPSPEEEAETPTEPARTGVEGVEGAPRAPAEVADGATAGRSEAEGGSDPADEPTFTPHTVRPELRNRGDVQRALEREYPPLLRDAGIGGTVTVWFFINDEGELENTEIAESSGQEALDRGALRVAETMEFTPALDGTDPVPVWISLPITFRTR